MTKAKARLRAKANAARKAKKRKADAGKPEQKFPAGRFDPGTGSIKGPEHEYQRQELQQGKKGRGAVGISRAMKRRRPQSTENTLGKRRSQNIWRTSRTATALPGASSFPAIAASPSNQA